MSDRTGETRHYTRGQQLVWLGTPFGLALSVMMAEYYFISTDNLLTVNQATHGLLAYTGIYRAYQATHNIGVLYFWIYSLSWPLMFILTLFVMRNFPFRPASRDPKFTRSRVITSLLFYDLASLVMIFGLSGFPVRYNQRYWNEANPIDVLWFAFWFAQLIVMNIGLLLQFPFGEKFFKGRPIGI